MLLLEHIADNGPHLGNGYAHEVYCRMWGRRFRLPGRALIAAEGQPGGGGDEEDYGGHG